MGSPGFAVSWNASGHLQLILGAILALLVGKTVLGLYHGVQCRLRFQKLRAQGIPILEPHSFVWGHLKLLGGIKSQFPPDANPNYSQIHIVQRWREFFPNASECPSVFYLDIWPIQNPIAVVVDPAMCQQIVVEKNLPRHKTTMRMVQPVTGTKNLIWSHGAAHRLWRSRLNPGFSQRNLQSHMPAIIDEVETFVRNLKATTRPDGTWGTVVPLLPRAIDLTFDIIGRVVLDLHLDEQNSGPTRLQSALRTLTTDHIMIQTLANLPKRLSPFYMFEEWRCNQELRKILVPRIKQQIGAEQNNMQKTVVQLAMKEYINETQDGKGNVSSEDFIEHVFGLTRLFLLAGHDTTAIVITWAFYHLPRHPDVLAKLRAEHDKVFGPDSASVSEALRQSPQLLNSLPYTLAVAKELLRLNPIAATFRQGSPDFFFTASDGARYPTDGFTLLTGTAPLHYHPEFWPRVNEFLPERFLVSQDDPLYPSSPGQWRPFEYGTMNCIGQEMAMIELRMVLLFTARELDVEPAYEEWDKLPSNAGKSKYKYKGERAYRLAKGLSPPNEQLPVHVRIRNQAAK